MTATRTGPRDSGEEIPADDLDGEPDDPGPLAAGEDVAGPWPDGRGTGEAASPDDLGLDGHLDDLGPLATGEDAAAPLLRHGYTLESLTRMAHYAARRGRYDHDVDLPVRYEVAWSAIAERLYEAQEPPTSAELIRRAWLAIRHHGEAERQFHGRARGWPAGPGRKFERYWRSVAAPQDSPEERLVDRIALAQIWPRLTPASRDALAALAAHGDYQLAARSLGLPYRSFVSRVSEARRQFLALWHQGEAPSRPWVRDRRAGPGTDMHTVTYFLRLRRLRQRAAAGVQQPGEAEAGVAGIERPE